MLISPSPTDTGSISTQHAGGRARRRAWAVRNRHTGKPIRRSTGNVISQLDEPCPRGRRSRRRRACSAPSNSGASPTSPAMITTFQTSGAIAGIVKWSCALRMPDDEAVEAEQHDDREQHLAEADGQLRRAPA